MDGESCPDCFLSLVIPAYNEADGIAQAVREADIALAELTDTYEIIVVDDGSADDTAAIVRELARQMPALRLLQQPGNQGYGAALRRGFQAARGERIAFTDADCQFHLADLAALIQLTDAHPIAVGYRKDRQDSMLRKFYSRGYNLLARTLLGTRVRDIDCALKVFRREALAQVLPTTSGFFVNTEMLTRAGQRGWSVAEAGVRHRPRLLGQSKVSLLDVPRTLNALLPFWWSNVLFPRRERSAEPAGVCGLAHLVVLAVMAGLLFLGRLGVPLLEPEEARYAEIPRQMLADGRLITPVLHGEAYYHKPPLLYWLVMGSYCLFGVHDWAARLVPSLCGVLMVLVTYLWMARAVGRWSAFAGAAILCLSAKFLYQAGMLTFDSPLCLFVLMSLACTHQALDGRRLHRGWWFAAGAACGLGVLTKGPVALALVVPPLVAWQFCERRTVRLSYRAWLGYLTAAAVVAGPWFVAVLWRDSAALGEFLWLHNLRRFVAPLDHEGPVWYYLPSLAIGMLPWSLLLAPCAVYLMRRSAAAGRRRPAALGFVLLAGGWCLLFFSCSGCKRPGYILPVYPLLAMALGTFVGQVMLAGLRLQRPDRVAWRGWAGAGAAVFALLLVGVHQLLPMYHRSFGLRGQVRSHLDIAHDANLPIVSYPKRWDSIGFYLHRNDVATYSPEQRGELLRELRRQEKTLLFVKQGAALDDLLQALPNDLEFVPRGRQGRKVMGGIVQLKEAGR